MLLVVLQSYIDGLFILVGWVKRQRAQHRRMLICWARKSTLPNLHLPPQYNIDEVPGGCRIKSETNSLT